MSGGSGVRLSASEERVYQDMLWWYREHPIQAARDILGIKLSIHQGIMLKTIFRGASSTILFCGRGTSKTFLLGLAALLFALLWPNEKCVVVGSGFRQAKEVMQESCGKIINCELSSQEQVWFARSAVKERPGSSKSVIIKGTDAWRIEFKNGSFIVAVPLSQSGEDSGQGGGNRIRGYRATRLFIDEAKDVPQHVISKVLEPMSIVSSDPVGDTDTGDNQTIYAGTIDYESNHFWSLIESHRDSTRSRDSKFYGEREICQFDYEDTYYIDENGKRMDWHIPYKMSIKKIELARDSGDVSEDDWRSEYKCVPIRNTGTYYPYSLIEEAKNFIVTENPDEDKAEEYLVPKLKSDSPVAIGIDVGRVDDFFAVVVISLNELDKREWDFRKQRGNAEFNHMIYAFQARNARYSFQAAKIREVMGMFPDTKIIGIDARGGDGVLDELAFKAPEGELPIYDPDDSSRAPYLVGKPGNSILYRIAATEVLNNEWNSFMRGQLEKHRFYFPKPMLRHANQDIEEIYHCIRIVTDQFIRLKTRMTKANMFSFYMDNPKKNKKDLYSATIYAMGAAKDILQNKKKSRKVHALAAWV